MAYCKNCGQIITEGALFCVGCGTPVKTEITPPAPVVSRAECNPEEQEFLETTHRLLRWERKAWSIASKFFLIFGIIYAALCMLFALIGAIAAIDGEAAAAFAVGFGFSYGITIGGMLIAFGIINKKACEKIPQYLNTVYTDFSLAYNRCGSIGMLVFTVLFGAVSPIFFIINFVRMKANRTLIENIMRKQNIPG